MDLSLSQHKRTLSLLISQVRNPRKQHSSLYTRCSAFCGAADFSPNPTIGRPVRSTDSLLRSTDPVDRNKQRAGFPADTLSGRPVRSTETNRELCNLQTSRSVDRPGRPRKSCAHCARRSTGPVDRHPGICCCCCFSAVSSVVSCRRLPRQSLDGQGHLPQYKSPSFQQFSTLAKIPKSEPTSNEPRSIT